MGKWRTEIGAVGRTDGMGIGWDWGSLMIGHRELFSTSMDLQMSRFDILFGTCHQSKMPLKIKA